MKNIWKVILIGIIGIALLTIAGIFLVQNFQNKAITMEEQVNAAQSNIKVQEKRRESLIRNLADCVKEYDKHESETLESIVDGRSSAGNIESATTAIAAVGEAYPELKSDKNYRQFMNELSVTENLISQYREKYNKQVKEYKRYVKSFPARNFLNALGYHKQNFEELDFDVSSDAPRNLFGE